MIGWKSDKRWSDKFMPEIKRHLGEVLIGEPPIAEDRERNTDLIVLKMEAVRIGCRIRRSKFIKYNDEFTIRAGRPSGSKTELTKIIEGWGDYFFYGISNESETALHSWIIGDLNAFRIWHSRSIVKNCGFQPGEKFGNRDSSSYFMVYKLREVDGFVVASGGPSND